VNGVVVRRDGVDYVRFGSVIQRGEFGEKYARRCPVKGCRTHAQYAYAKVQALLDALAEPGLDKTWVVTDQEMSALVGNPERAAAYLAAREAERSDTSPG
jgi:hypothetical protein